MAANCVCLHQSYTNLQYLYFLTTSIQTFNDKIHYRVLNTNSQEVKSLINTFSLLKLRTDRCRSTRIIRTKVRNNVTDKIKPGETLCSHYFSSSNYMYIVLKSTPMICGPLWDPLVPHCAHIKRARVFCYSWP